MTYIPFPWQIAPWWCVWEFYEIVDYIDTPGCAVYYGWQND